MVSGTLAGKPWTILATQTTPYAGTQQENSAASATVWNLDLTIFLSLKVIW